MTRYLIEHVVEKGNSGLKASVAAAIEIELDPDLRFQGITSDFRLTHDFSRLSNGQTDPHFNWKFVDSNPESARDLALLRRAIF